MIQYLHTYILYLTYVHLISLLLLRMMGGCSKSHFNLCRFLYNNKFLLSCGENGEISFCLNLVMFWLVEI